jgi:DNA-binding SARP family transcriptional activator
MGAPDNLDTRLVALADEGWPLARSAVALARSVAAQQRGDARAALAETEGFDRSDPVQYQGALRGRLLSLGRPEMIPAAVDALLGGGSVDVFDAQALWWRGEVPPELAWIFAVELHNTYADRRVAAVQVALDSVVATVALAAGHVVEARRFADLAIATAPRTMAHMAGFAGVADALVALVEHGESEFEARFDKLLADVPLLPWPAWAYMSALTPIRALLPDGDQLDGLDVGPSLRVAIDAGRAVAALRRTGDPAVATTLPWSQIDLLRVHVPVPMLCELALAAGTQVPAAAAALEVLPHCSRWVRRFAGHPSPTVRRAATIAAKAYPARPDEPMRITTLGRFCVECPPGLEVPDWDRRERVRHLLAELVVRRSVGRAELAAAMWPDLAPEKAANNLRVNLHHVQQVLEPNRAPDAPPGYVQQTATDLRLSADDVAIDTDLFDARIADALAAERRGSPSAALADYEAACELYGGDFLPGIELEAVVNERTRLRSVAHGALCRRGELILARGEPELALALAGAAQQLDEMSERAARLAIKCHLAVGSMSAARAVARQVVDVLADAGIEQDPETRGLLGRLAAGV